MFSKRRIILESFKIYVHFVHLDFDAFLLHDVFKNNKPDIVVAYKEYHQDIASSDLWQFSEGMDAYNTVDLTFGDVASHYVGLYDRTYNCSVVGGKNLNLIKIRKYVVNHLKPNIESIQDNVNIQINLFYNMMFKHIIKIQKKESLEFSTTKMIAL